MNSIVKEKRYISEKLGVAYESLSQAYLRAETQLLTTSKVNFTLQRNKATSTTPTERLLDLNDEFVITEMFVGLKNLTASGITDENHAKAFVTTYENASYGGNMIAIYNSNLNFTIDRTEYIPQFPTRAFRRVPLQQIQADADNPNADPLSWDGFPVGNYGFAQSEPTLIDGRQTLDVSLDFNETFVNNIDTGAFVILELRGYLVTNAK